MIVLERFALTEEPCVGRMALIFGAGLIGRSVVDALCSAGYRISAELPFSWRPAGADTKDTDRILNYLVSRLSTARWPQCDTLLIQFDVIWSAGRGGFTSTSADLEPELLSFDRVLALASRLLNVCPASICSFHLFSSAGGLFEGQCNVGPESEPSPKRPYAELKLRQEARLASLDSTYRKLIYRPTSVYGFVFGHARMGLVTTLIKNGLLQKITRVFGQPGTLRDYVLASDIGRFVLRVMESSSRQSAVFVLGSGKPSTIAEISHMTELVLDRAAYVVFQQASSNAEHITFNPAVLPSGWRATDLPTGMMQTKLALLDHFSRAGAVP